MERFWQVLAQKGPYFLATLLGVGMPYLLWMDGAFRGD